MGETLHIATAIDEAYIVPLRVMLGSLIAHLSPRFRPVLHLMHRSLQDHQIETITQLVEVRSIVPDADAMAALPRHPSFPAEAAFPLLLPDLISGTADRVLFLDPDTFIADDVAKIWEVDLRHNVIAAAVDQAIPFCSSARGVKTRRELGIPEKAAYFNAGVMLIDIARWKRDDISARAHRYLERIDGQSDFLHQEALNAVLWDRWLELEQRWNLIASLSGRRYGSSESVDSPGIIHFAGVFKPWRFRTGGPFADSYKSFVERTSEAMTQERSPRETLLSIYDVYLRDYFYGIENVLWKNRLI